MTVTHETTHNYYDVEHKGDHYTGLIMQTNDKTEFYLFDINGDEVNNTEAFELFIENFRN